MAYLEFSTLDEYLNYLKSKDCSETHLILTGILIEAGDLGSKNVNYYTVLTQRLDSSNQEIIVCCAVRTGITNTFALETDTKKQEAERFLTKVRDFSAEIKAEVESKGFNVLAGKWSQEAPAYLVTSS